MLITSRAPYVRAGTLAHARAGILGHARAGSPWRALSRSRRIWYGIDVSLPDWIGLTGNRSATAATTAATATPGHGLYTGTVAVWDLSRPTDRTVLIDLIQPELHGPPTRPNDTPSLLILLITPCISRLTKDKHELEAAILRKLRQSGTALGNKPCDVFTACVDRLPVPNSSPIGVQGLAYALVTDPLPLYVDSQVRRKEGASSPASLFLEIPPSAKNARPDTFTLELPLTQDSLGPCHVPLTHRHFDAVLPTGCFKLRASQDLESQIIRLPMAACSKVLEYRAPLVPLSVCKRIGRCDGNVLHELNHKDDRLFERSPSADDAGSEKPGAVGGTLSSLPSTFSKTKAPANFLRKALAAYTKKVFGKNTREIVPGFDVWALVGPDIPNHYNIQQEDQHFMTLFRHDMLLKLWPAEHSAGMAHINIPEIFHKLKRGQFLQALQRNARFARVVNLDADASIYHSSLALQPETSYSSPAHVSSTTHHESLGPKLTHGICRENEYIMFFVVPHRSPEIALEQGLAYDVESELHSNAIIFGAIPDVQSDANAADANDSACTHHPHRFGALSKRGMAVMVRSGQWKAAERKEMLPMKTRLDMPFGRLGLGMVKTTKWGSAKPIVEAREEAGEVYMSSIFRPGGVKM